MCVCVWQVMAAQSGGDSPSKHTVDGAEKAPAHGMSDLGDTGSCSSCMNVHVCACTCVRLCVHL